MTISLDKYDKKLIYELDKNSRQSFNILAKKVGLSKDSIRYRLDQYFKKGIVDGYYTLINTGKLGFHTIRIYIDFRKTTPQKEEEMIEKLTNSKLTGWVSRNDGQCNLGIGFWVKTISQFQDFWKNFKEEYNQYLDNEKIGLFTSMHHFERNYLIEDKSYSNPKIILEKENNENIDQIDLNILHILSKNAREQILNIANKLNLSSKSIIERIKKLEKKNIIMSYRIKLNQEKLGYSLYKIDLKLNSQKKLKEMKNYIFSLPNIFYSEEVFAGSDFEFDLEVESFEKYNLIINEIKEKFGEEIDEIKYYKTIKVYKINYLPE